MSIRERAQLTIAAGYRAFRMGAADLPANTTYNTHIQVNKLYDDCVQAREGVGNNGDWIVDFHQRFDLSDAIRGCNLIENLAPYFVEDPVRAEAFQQDLPILRQKVNVPFAAGEEWGNRWDFQPLGGKPRYRLRSGDASERRWNHRDDEDRGRFAERILWASCRILPVLSRPPLW